MSELDPTGGGAACAIHAGSPAVAVCERCGSYMCQGCQAAGRDGVCPTCREAVGTGFSLTRDAFSVDQVLSIGFDAFKREWLMLSVGALIFFVIAFVIGQIANIIQNHVTNAVVGHSVLGGPMMALMQGEVSWAQLVGIMLTTQLVVTAAEGPIVLGFIRLGIDAAEGRPVEIGHMFGEARKLWKYLVMLLASFVLFLVPLAVYGGIVAGIVTLAHAWHDEDRLLLIAGIAWLVAIVPLVWYGLGFVFSQIELVYDDAVGPIEAIVRSWKLARGFRLATFLVLLVCFGVMLGGFLACCIGLLPAFAAEQLLLAVLFLGLRNGSGLPEPRTWRH